MTSRGSAGAVGGIATGGGDSRSGTRRSGDSRPFRSAGGSSAGSRRAGWAGGASIRARCCTPEAGSRTGRPADRAPCDRYVRQMARSRRGRRRLGVVLRWLERGAGAGLIRPVASCLWTGAGLALRGGTGRRRCSGPALEAARPGPTCVKAEGRFVGSNGLAGRVVRAPAYAPVAAGRGGTSKGSRRLLGSSERPCRPGRERRAGRLPGQSLHEPLRVLGHGSPEFGFALDQLHVQPSLGTREIEDLGSATSGRLAPGDGTPTRAAGARRGCAPTGSAEGRRAPSAAAGSPDTVLRPADRGAARLLAWPGRAPRGPLPANRPRHIGGATSSPDRPAATGRRRPHRCRWAAESAVRREAESSRPRRALRWPSLRAGCPGLRPARSRGRTAVRRTGSARCPQRARRRCARRGPPADGHDQGRPGPAPAPVRGRLWRPRPGPCPAAPPRWRCRWPPPPPRPPRISRSETQPCRLPYSSTSLHTAGP